MLATFTIAVEATIVSTAMPQIAGQLGDLHLYAWVFSAFLLAQTACTVIFGKLADLFGRKPVLLVGIGIFVTGSVLCGFAWSMPSLIAFRLLQGVGGGAIQPVSLTIIGDLYTVQERGRIQGWLASVWGVSSIAGPLAGGLIIAHLSWSWVFWINVPVGLLACAGFVAFLHEARTPKVRDVDVPGAALFAIGVAALMVAITQVGSGETGTAGIAAAVAAVAGTLFVWQERRAADPMLAFGLWARRPIATANATTLLAGMVIVGLTAFVPMYVQGVLGQSALVAGFALTAMVLGWPVGATVAARNFGRFGLRGTLLSGAALLPVGAVAFVLLWPGASPLLAATGSLVVGLGMGLMSTSAIVIIQDCVGWAERGSATASNIFSRNLGSTLGATVLGGVLNAGIATRAEVVDMEQVRALLDHPGAVAGNPAVREALGQALHGTFWGVFVVAAAALLLALLVPRVVIKPAVAVGE